MEAESPNFERLRHVREEKFREQTLISHRVGWLLTMQAFLMTTFAVLVNGDMASHWWIPCLVLPLFGLFMALTSVFPISAACATLDYWHLIEKAHYWTDPNLRGMTTADRPDHWHYLSMRLPRILPWVFAGFWLASGTAVTLQSRKVIDLSLPVHITSAGAASAADPADSFSRS